MGEAMVINAGVNPGSMELIVGYLMTSKSIYI